MGRFEAFETKLIVWITEQRKLGHILDGRRINNQALLLAEEEHIIGFKASNGWRDRMLFRNNVALRRVTHSGSKLPDVDKLVDIIVNFFKACKTALSGEILLKRNEVFSMDESMVRLDDPESKTYTHRGKGLLEIFVLSPEIIRNFL